jgi:hypothetical protein
MTMAGRLAGGIALVALGVASGAIAQERPLQTGTKTTEPGFVTSTELDVPTGDMEQGQRAMADGLALLREATQAAGFTLTGKARAVVQFSMQGPPGDTVPFLLQLFIAEQPTDEDLKAEFDFQLLPVKAEKVAYTYHKGPLAEVQRTFMRLWQWSMAQGLDVAGYPCMVVQGISEKAPDVIEVQLPVK